jgi:hypothetical protein
LNNDVSAFGGVAPSQWTDGDAQACQILPDKDVQRTLFVQKGYPGNNATVYADQWASYSSTNGKVVVVMFRVRNTTGSAIWWNVYWRYTCHAVWNERASVAVNGNCIGAMRACAGGLQSEAVGFSLPANRTSTVIFVATSGIAATAQSVRATELAFYNNSLILPAGLEFVDDLETATGGYEQ